MLALSYMGEENCDGNFWTHEEKMTNGKPEPSLEIHIKNQTLFRKLKAKAGMVWTPSEHGRQEHGEDAGHGKSRWQGKKAGKSYEKVAQ